MWRLAGLVLLIGACKFEHGLIDDPQRDDGRVDTPETPPGDGDVDSTITPLDAPPGGACYGSTAFAFCVTTAPTMPYTLSSDISTSGTSTCAGGDGIVMQVAGASACVIAATMVDSAATIINVTGPRPLVIASSGTLTIMPATLIDVASSRAGGKGAGANSPDCGANPADGAGNASGGAGGAGGSFGTKGGDGGNGGGVNGPSAKAAVSTPVTKLRGGCEGGHGGSGNGGDAEGGSSGGAIYLVSNGAMTIQGTINASGAGGVGGKTAKGGGGGGGSGGMIVLHASTLAVTGNVFANGGGGGGGAGQGTPGDPGSDATDKATPAAGGPNMSGGAFPGGDGAIQGVPPGSPSTSGNGGGGGGGGLGVIRVFSTNLVNAMSFSPAPS